MWAQELLESLDRKKVEITFHPHVFDRQEYWNLDLDKIEETIRTGKILEKKCEMPNKLCFQRYFGKENLTYIIVTKFHRVRTAWPKKGR